MKYRYIGIVGVVKALIALSLIAYFGLAITTATQIVIYASDSSIVEDEAVNLTVIAPINHSIMISSSNPEPTVFPGGVSDNPGSDTKGSFEDIITEKDKKTYIVYFTSPGDYRVKAIDLTSDLEVHTDISVEEKRLEFDVVSHVSIGSVLNIKGNTNTGKTVDIAIRDVVMAELNDIPIEDNTFGIGIDTAADYVPYDLKKPGSVSLKGFIDREYGSGEIGDGEEKDGSTAILLTAPSLDVEVSPCQVVAGESFDIYGTATGKIEILIISPEGSQCYTYSTGIEAGSMFDHVCGINYYKLTPSPVDGSFSKRVHTDYDIRGGRCIVMVLNPSIDGVYGDTNRESISDFAHDLEDKSQEEIFNQITDICTKSGSDDLFSVCYIRVEATSNIELNPVEAILIGEILVVRGSCDRKDGSVIVISVKGPKELGYFAAEVEDGKFNAVFDTTNAIIGTYTIKAEDEEGYFDTTTVDICGKPSGTIKETPTPEHLIKPSETPSPTPKPGEPSVYLHGEKTSVTVGGDILLSLSAVNLITKPTMTLQLILKVPSGMSITSTEFIESGMGQYTATYTVEPGKERHISVNIKTNQAGDFNVEGDICYYFGGDKSTAEYKKAKLPVKVNPISASTPTGTTHTPSPTETSGFEGFEVVFATAGLLAVAYLVGRKK